MKNIDVVGDVAVDVVGEIMVAVVVSEMMLPSLDSGRHWSWEHGMTPSPPGARLPVAQSSYSSIVEL